MTTKNYLGRDFKRKRTKDKITVKQRSAVMSKIKSLATGFELAFTRRLRKKIRLKFVTNLNSMRGKPDIVFLKQKVVVFLDSDFWHGWQFNRWKHLLKNEFWRTKIRNNRHRDNKTTKYLRRHGWKVLRFWEHAISKDVDMCVQRIKEAL